ncbi:hypothetical protein SEA_SPELLY_186 [Streptomyces phage Spelly]|nr:hypothetical protein SEA_SPELLY_186 [Streptomyces phage Spelly]
MQIGFEYIEGSGPFTVVGYIGDSFNPLKQPFELHYHDGFAELIVITDDFVVRATGKYNRGIGVLNAGETGQLIFNLVHQLDNGN